jgi:TonB family protein
MVLLLALVCALQTPVASQPRPNESRPGAAPAARGTEGPKVIKKPSPSYPEEALRAGMDGLVILEGLLDQEGRVAQARVLQGDPPLSDAAVEAFKKWRYSMDRLPKGATGVVVTVTMNFDSRSQRELSFSDLLSSLKSDHEAARASAAEWLGRFSNQMPAQHAARAVRELKALQEREQSERVKEAAAHALAKLERPLRGAAPAPVN